MWGGFTRSGGLAGLTPPNTYEAGMARSGGRLAVGATGIVSWEVFGLNRRCETETGGCRNTVGD
jgi:hypothetical protein